MTAWAFNAHQTPIKATADEVDISFDRDERKTSLTINLLTIHKACPLVSPSC